MLLVRSIQPQKWGRLGCLVPSEALRTPHAPDTSTCDATVPHLGTSQVANEAGRSPSTSGSSSMTGAAAGTAAQQSGQQHNGQLNGSADLELGTANGDVAAGSGVAIEPVATAGAVTGSEGRSEDHGMVLPFNAVTLTFRDVHYFVPTEVGLAPAADAPPVEGRKDTRRRLCCLRAGPAAAGVLQCWRHPV